jgi:hypothetical protein
MALGVYQSILQILLLLLAFLFFVQTIFQAVYEFIIKGRALHRFTFVSLLMSASLTTNVILVYMISLSSVTLNSSPVGFRIAEDINLFFPKLAYCLYFYWRTSTIVKNHPKNLSLIRWGTISVVTLNALKVLMLIINVVINLNEVKIAFYAVEACRGLSIISTAVLYYIIFKNLLKESRTHQLAEIICRNGQNSLHATAALIVLYSLTMYIDIQTQSLALYGLILVIANWISLIIFRVNGLISDRQEKSEKRRMERPNGNRVSKESNEPPMVEKDSQISKTDSSQTLPKRISGGSTKQNPGNLAIIVEQSE